MRVVDHAVLASVGLRTMRRRKPEAIAYLCLEAPRTSLASYIHSRAIAEGLRRLGFTVDLFAPERARVLETLSWRVLSGFILQARLLLQCRRYKAVYVRSHPLAFPVTWCCRLMGIPVIQEVNGSYHDIYLAYPKTRLLAPVINCLLRWQFRCSSGLIAVTPGLARWLQEEVGYAGAMTALITNGADTDTFRPNRCSPIPLPRPYVVFVGSRTAWHDVKVLLEALREPSWPADVKLVLVGDCGNAPAVQAAVKHRANLIVAGCLSHADVGGILAGAEAAIIAISDPQRRSSSYGVAPLKLFEALACGTPVIASELPYQADLVREIRGGVTYAPGNPIALAQAVAEVHDQFKLRYDRDSVVRRVQEEHSWDKRARQTAEFIEQLLRMAPLRRHKSV